MLLLHSRDCRRYCFGTESSLLFRFVVCESDGNEGGGKGKSASKGRGGSGSTSDAPKTGAKSVHEVIPGERKGKR
jgi:hypothetical protein